MNGVRVKPLAWSSVDEICTRETAPALGGSYNIVMLDGDEGPPSLNFDLGGMLTFRFVLEPDPLGMPGDRRPRQFGSVAEAKAFAQDDYEARIRSALEPSAAPACGVVEILEGVQAWQPIDTAPTDDTEVMLCDNRVGGGFIITASRQTMNGESFWVQPDGTIGYQDAFFTHWMPLPAPPAPATTAQDDGREG